MKSITVVLAEDHALVRAGLRSLLQDVEGIKIVGEAADGHEALRLVAERGPDVVLMDVSMPRLNGLEAAARVAKDHPGTRVLILSMHANEAYIHQALRSGAAGYLLKDADQAELELAIHAVARGHTYLSRAIPRKGLDAIAARAPAAPEGGPLEALTPRQREILQLVAEGHTTRDIATTLDLSAKTVEAHRTQIMERLGIHDLAGLVRFAIRVGLITADQR